MYRFLAAVMLSACGRVGFDVKSDAGGDAMIVVPPDQIAVVVRNDGDPVAPVDGAYVVVESGASANILRTDATGTAQFAATQPTTFHVGFKEGTGWRIFSLLDTPPGIAIVLGGRTNVQSNHTITYTLPNNGGVAYGIMTSSRCGARAESTSTSVVFSYPAFCEGMAYDVRAYSIDSGGVAQQIDAGPLGYMDSATQPIVGSYATLTPHTFKVTNLPAATIDAEAYGAMTVGDDLFETGPAVSIAPVGGVASLQVPTPDAPDTAVLAFAQETAPLEVSVAFAAVPLSTGTATYDGAGMLPLVENFDATNPLRATWTMQQAGRPTGDVLVYDALYDQTEPVLWTAIGPPNGRTSIAYPAVLPTALAGATPTTKPIISVLGIVDTPDFTGAADAMPHADLELGWVFSKLGTYWRPGILLSLASDPPITR